MFPKNQGFRKMRYRTQIKKKVTQSFLVQWIFFFFFFFKFPWTVLESRPTIKNPSFEPPKKVPENWWIKQDSLLNQKWLYHTFCSFRNLRRILMREQVIWILLREYCTPNFFFFFFFSGWCCHGVTTQVFYSENIRYNYHMQSWIWIWYALITPCSDYHTDVWNPPLLRAVIGLPKCSSSLDPAKFGRKKERTAPLT